MKKVFYVLGLMILTTAAMASEGAAGAQSYTNFGYFIAMGLAALGGTLGQSKAASAALEGIARNPNAADKVFTPMLLGLAFMESLVIFTLISIFIAR